MPCYEVRTVSVQFKVENSDFLEKALKCEGCTVEYRNEERIAFRDKFGIRFLINFDQSTISNGGTRTDERQMTTFANSIKRAYSAVVIDEVAKKAKWLKRDLGQNRYQLQRY